MLDRINLSFQSGAAQGVAFANGLNNCPTSASEIGELSNPFAYGEGWNLHLVSIFATVGFPVNVTFLLQINDNFFL